jgi:tetratricopeptide (TPR) repeat protein
MTMVRMRKWAIAVCLAGIAAPLVLAQERFIEDVQVSRTDEDATIVIRLACRMRFLADVPTEQGVLLEIRLAPLDTCRQLRLGTGIANELYRPIGGRLASLSEVEYESLGLDDNLIMLRFERPVAYSVIQGGDLHSVEIHVQPAPGEAIRVEPVESPEPLLADDLPTSALAPTRDPLHRTIREPVLREDYVLNLESSKEPITPLIWNAVSVPEGRKLYVSEARVGADIWYRLRLGFFATEEAAGEALAGLREHFPRAWIGRADPPEIAVAGTYRTEIEGAPESLPTVSLAAAQTAASTEVRGEPDPAHIQELLQSSREALVAGRYPEAIDGYTRALQVDGEHVRIAREMLGLAHEKSGQLAQAEAEYRQYLAEFPDGEEASRVQQRLNGVVLAASETRAPGGVAEARGASPDWAMADATHPRWSVASGVAQYYRRNVSQFDQDQEEIVALSAIFSDIDFTARRTGGDVDFLSRVAMSHVYDVFLDDRDGGAFDSSRISYAYFDVGDAAGRWSLRSGRQSLHSWGILGRFDGAHFSYGANDSRRWHVLAGYPVESTRVGIRTDRSFLAAGAEFEDVLPGWDLGAAINQQVIEGIQDRLSVASELRYLGDSRSLVAIVDYDMGYGELNTALVFGTWRLPNRMVLSTSLDWRKTPILTTRNALIGQPVSTIDELLLVWSEEEVRELALDRTAQAQSATVGLAMPLGERFQLNADVTVSEIESTRESGGVPSVPGIGLQTYYASSLIGSGLFRSGDVNIWSLQHLQSDTFMMDSIVWDSRFPLGRRLRLNPRLRYSVRKGVGDGTSQKLLSPSLRLLLSMPNHYRIELEIGAAQGDRESAVAATQESSGYFMNLGYRADF